MAIACMLSGQERPACKLCGRDRKEGDAAAPLPSFSSLFITSSLQGGLVLKRNLAQFRGDALRKVVTLLRHQIGHRKTDKS